MAITEMYVARDGAAVDPSATKGLGRATGPAVGCVASALGTAVAVALFPDDPSPRGALVVPGLVLSLAIIMVPALRWLSAAPTRMNAENFVAVGYVFWLLLDLVQGAYDLRDAADESLRMAMVAIGVSAAAMWLGVVGRPWRLPKGLIEMATTPLENKLVGRLVLVCFVLGMFNFAFSVDFDIPRMFSYLGEQRWAAPWGRGQLGGWDAFLDQLPYFGYVLPSLTAVLLVRRGFTFQTVVALGASAIMLLFLAQGGGRRIIGVTVGAAIIVWVQSQPSLNLRKLLTVGAAIVALLWTMQFMLNIRSQGYGTFIAGGGSEYDYLHVDDNFLRLAQVIQIVPAQHDYVYFQQVFFTLIRPIPRVFWPGKPINPGFDLPAEMGMKGVSLSSSIVGEWYLSYGWLTVVFGGWLHGRLSAAANGLRDLSQFDNPVVYALSVMVLVSGMRSMQDLVIMSYALVAFWGASRLSAPAREATR